MSERRNKKETEQLFNMPEITRMEKKALSGAREKLEDSKLRKVLIWVFEIVVTLIFAVLTSMMLFQSVTMQESVQLEMPTAFTRALYQPLMDIAILRRPKSRKVQLKKI